MAAFTVSPELSLSDTTPNWRMQSKRRIDPGPSALSAGGNFATWTNVPPVGVPDPHTAAQMRLGRTTFPHFKPTVSGKDPYAVAAGKRITTLPDHPDKGDGRFHYPHLTNAGSMTEVVSRGVRCVSRRRPSSIASCCKVLLLTAQPGASPRARRQRASPEWTPGGAALR